MTEGLYTGLDSRSNLWNLVLTPTPRTRGPGVYVQAFADDVVLMFSGQSASALEAETNRTLAHPGRPRLPGVESGDSQDDIRRRDRADSHVRFVRLGPKKLGVRKMLDALQRSVALKACRAYRTVSSIPR
ncbi:hypothetical protein EVAR_85577_1 [Eumeta japonica]|uniref:Reverse transcriptase domain-containing protein n=1 Tax=Eumeta variegata TaxID=151549 RepID=A0A4C2A9M6_EUMVA|nr:hypothetical protein EVAR_85577_1 [Eumeta japonica]